MPNDDAARAPGALDGLAVLDLSESVAGQFCGRMLADYGADVLLVEPPGGSAVRGMLPRDADGSVLFHHANHGKRSVTLDQDTAPGRAMLRDLARAADVVVVGPAADRDALLADNPAAVVALVSDFGADGPRSAWRSSEMIAQALSGMMYGNGSPGREPLHGVAQRASVAAGMGATIAVLAALHARDATGQGQQVAVDVVQNASAMCMPAALEYVYNGMPPVRAQQTSPFGVVRCRDSWICFWLYDHAWPGMCNVLGRPELIGDARFRDAKARQGNWSALTEEVQAAVAHRDADEVIRALTAARLVCARAQTATQLRHGDAHLQQRGFWEEVRTRGGSRPILGPQFRMGATPRHVRGAAPELAPEAEARPAFASTFAPRRGAAPTPGKGPLAGLRVVEFTTAWAGPMAGRILGFLGADVVHVEAPAKLDLWRQHTVLFNPRRYPDGEGGARPFDRNALFNSQNQNKRSFCVDAKQPRGAEAIRRLAAASDIVLCNFTANTLERMGFGYAALRQVRRDIIVVDMPGFGNAGPQANAPANGFSMEMAAGMSAMIGYPGGAPMTTGPFYPDPIGGYHGAAAALTALRHRQATGEGQYVEVPQVEASMHCIGDALLHAINTNTDPEPQGNRVAWAAPHDAYRARGEDEWVAIAVEGDAEWRTLCRVMGDAALAEDPRFRTVPARWENQAELRAPITAWTQRHSKFEAAERLQAAGLRAAPVLDPRDILADPYLAARGAFAPLHHPQAGTHLHQTLPFRFSRTPGAQRTASPCLGADNAAILRELGYAAEEIEALQRDGVVADAPQAGRPKASA